MKETNNYKIGYPEPADFVDTETFKNAFTIIDAEIKKAAGAGTDLSNYYTITEINKIIGDIDTILNTINGEVI